MYELQPRPGTIRTGLDVTGPCWMVKTWIEGRLGVGWTLMMRPEEKWWRSGVGRERNHNLGSSVGDREERVTKMRVRRETEIVK